jgi:hypothetical protein
VPRRRASATNDVYIGAKGYPAIIDVERFERAQRAIRRMDPAAIQRRKGGRPASKDYLLSGFAFCTCGARLYTCPNAKLGGRCYVCAHVRQSTGLCNAQPIPAALAEAHVLRHLDWFIAELDAWVAERLAERSDEHLAVEATVEAHRTTLSDLDRRPEQRMVELEEVGITPVGRRSSSASTVSERRWEDHRRRRGTGDRVDCRPEQRRRARLLRPHPRSRAGQGCQGRRGHELRAAFSEVLAGVWLELQGPVLRADFELCHQLAGDPLLSMLPVGERMEFYGAASPDLPSQTQRQGFV